MIAAVLAVKHHQYNVGSLSMSIELWRMKDEKGTRTVTAYKEDGCLRISGQDLYPNKENIFNTSEYEYIYGFDCHNTERLFNLITDNGLSNEAALLSIFGGEHGCKNLTEFCEANEIKYEFYSHFDMD